MVRLSEDSKTKIEAYVKQGYLQQDLILQIWRDYPLKKTMKILKEHLFVNEITFNKIWLYIIYQVWKDLDSMFDKREVVLLKALLWNDGVMLRTQIKNNELNEYMTTKAIDSLSERNIIDCLSFCKNQKVIILHPKFKHEVFNHGGKDNGTTE